jgi:hypothetical protein
MRKLMRRLIATLLMLVVVFGSAPTTVFADTDTILKDKTNKLILGDTIEEGTKKINETLDAGKSLTYKLEVPNGGLFIEITGDSSFKVQIYNSKNKVVKKLEAVDLMGGAAQQIRNCVALSKGKYKIKISAKSKDSALTLNGKVAMISNKTSRTIACDKEYTTAVTKGKTYKFKFEVEEKSTGVITSFINNYDSTYIFPEFPIYKVADSKGKIVKSFTKGETPGNVDLKKGTYTLIVEANMTGYLTIRVAY